MPSHLVQVTADHRGRWNVSVPDAVPGVTCASLDEARRLARRCAERYEPCELVIHDAYDRVLEYRLMTGAGDGEPGAGR